jgi:hypothetical protein
MAYQASKISIIAPHLASGWQKRESKWQGRASSKTALNYANRVIESGQLELVLQIARFDQLPGMIRTGAHCLPFVAAL